MEWKSIIQEIESDENKRRKAEHEKRSRVYNDYQREYVLEMLRNEFSEQTVREMRTMTSINLCRRIIDEMASIYKRKPEREFKEVNETQEDGIETIYQDAKVDTFLKRANQKYKLHHQCAVQVIPKDGKISLRVLSPNHYDVIPNPENPEEALAYVISAYDKTLADNAINAQKDIQGNYYGSKNQSAPDGVNQKIADEDDWKQKQKFYVVWTNESVIKLDSDGNVVSNDVNPIGMLPFIDVAAEKDFEFWVRRGSGVSEFNLDFLVVCSDTVNTNRLQSYAQPVIVAEKIPESVTVGPQHILFLPLDPTRPEVKPSFEFASPNPDLKSSLDLQDRLINYFLTAQGISPKTISGTAESQKFTSGLERLLAMIERFEASQSDIDLFIDVENKLFTIMRAWYEAISGTDALDQKYNFGAWPESSYLSVDFKGPEAVQTEADKEDSVIKRLDSGLISKVEAIAELRGISIEEAKKIDLNNNMEA
jgi:hypothetical protein